MGVWTSTIQKFTAIPSSSNGLVVFVFFFARSISECVCLSVGSVWLSVITMSPLLYLIIPPLPILLRIARFVSFKFYVVHSIEYLFYIEIQQNCSGVYYVKLKCNVTESQEQQNVNFLFLFSKPILSLKYSLVRYSVGVLDLCRLPCLITCTNVYYIK